MLASTHERVDDIPSLMGLQQRLHLAELLDQCLGTHHLHQGPSNGTLATTLVQKWLKANPRVVVLWLPKYSAHQSNLTEGIWGLMKDAVAANRLAGSIGELVKKARHFLDHGLLPHPVTLPVTSETTPDLWSHA